MFFNHLESDTCAVSNCTMCEIYIDFVLHSKLKHNYCNKILSISHIFGLGAFRKNRHFDYIVATGSGKYCCRPPYS